MTINTIVKKLFKNNLRQYALFICSILFAVMMIGAYGIIQFSPTVTAVLMDGGSTEQITICMLAFTLIGTFVFIVFVHSLFLKHKSTEIGIFMSLGISRHNCRKMITKELSLIFAIATLAGLILSLPTAWLSWSILTFFVRTQETAFTVGWSGLLIAVLFSVFSMLVVRILTSRYIKRIDIIRILKATEEVEDIKGNKFIFGLLGAIMIPVGILLYTYGELTSFLGDITDYSLVLSLIGLYLLIAQITSIGAFVQKVNPKHYYKNIVFFNLLKLKGKQYTLSLFVSTILIAVSVFGVAFMTAPLMSAMLTTIYSDPYDFMVKAGFQQGGFNEKDIVELAKAHNIELKDLKKFDTILLAELNKKYNEWSPICVVSEETVSRLTGKTLDIDSGCYIHAISGDENTDVRKYLFEPQGSTTILNPKSKEEFSLEFKGIKFFDRLLCQDTMFFEGDFYVVDTELFNKLYKNHKREYVFTTYVFNVYNWRETKDFSEALFKAIAEHSGGKWSPNYPDGAIFDRIKKQSPDSPAEYQYQNIEENPQNVNRWWQFAPYSRYHKVYDGMSDYAVYFLLILYIFIIAFVSAIMVIGVKILNTMWQDKRIYKNITFLGVRTKEIKSIVSKQVALIYFVPVVLGIVITLFLFYSMLKITAIDYQNVSFLFACGLSLIVFLVQVGLFFVIRKQAVKECLNFENI